MNDASYADIIELSRPVSKRHPRMPLADRAAQFAPFAALNGFEEELQETARQTVLPRELDESEQTLINDRLQLLADRMGAFGSSGSHPQITITYFVPDFHKTGGTYQTKTGAVKKIDLNQRSIIFTDDTPINIDSLAS